MIKDMIGNTSKIIQTSLAFLKQDNYELIEELNK